MNPLPDRRSEMPLTTPWDVEQGTYTAERAERLRRGDLPGREIEWRYLNDAEFHMRVELAVQALERDRSVRLNPEDRSLATLAAAYAINGEES